MIADFYKPFEQNITVKMKELDKSEFVKPEELEEKCPECGKNLQIKFGRYGKFIACSGYPECKYSRPLEDRNPKDEVTGKDGEMESIAEAEKEKCEKCGGSMILKEGRFGKFLACSNYPKCKNTKAIVQSSGIKCPECGEGELVMKRTKRGRAFWGCSRYPGCKYATWNDPSKSEEKNETEGTI